MPVDDMGHHVSASDKMQLVPIVHMDVTGQLLTIPQRRQQPRTLILLGSDELSPPSDDAASGRLLIELPGIPIAPIEIELRAEHVPLGL